MIPLRRSSSVVYRDVFYVKRDRDFMLILPVGHLAMLPSDDLPRKSPAPEGLSMPKPPSVPSKAARAFASEARERNTLNIGPNTDIVRSDSNKRKLVVNSRVLNKLNILPGPSGPSWGLAVCSG
jgi:hypothetical protein